jgi:hypothetical protein
MAPAEGSLGRNAPVDVEKLRPRQGPLPGVSQVEPLHVPDLTRQ